VTVPLALSTMWAQQERFRGRFREFVEIARRSGFDAIEVSHSTDEAGLTESLSCGVLPVVSLHAPAPFQTTSNGRPNSSLNLAATDDIERRDAVAATCRTIDFAADAGVRLIVVHLGSIDRGPREHERRLRGLFASGAIEQDEAIRVRDEAIAARAADAPPHLDAARRSLAEIVAYGGHRGVTVGLETRLHFFEIPAPEEALDLLGEYRPDEAGYWHDTGHAEVWSRLGLVPHRRWFELLGGRLIGAHLHDVNGLRDHRAPGNGTLDWEMVRDGIPPRAARTCEIDQHEPEESLSAAIALLRDEGVTGSGPRGPAAG
jgi:sugar phosphate isomerase/epimerase